MPRPPSASCRAAPPAAIPPRPASAARLTAGRAAACPYRLSQWRRLGAAQRCGRRHALQQGGCSRATGLLLPPSLLHKRACWLPNNNNNNNNTNNNNNNNGS
jgi:hypothetical protein